MLSSIWHQILAKLNTITLSTYCRNSNDNNVITIPFFQFKSVFMGLSQSTTGSTQQSQKNQRKSKGTILAEDTDEEDG